MTTRSRPSDDRARPAGGGRRLAAGLGVDLTAPDEARLPAPPSTRARAPLRTRSPAPARRRRAPGPLGRRLVGMLDRHEESVAARAAERDDTGRDRPRKDGRGGAAGRRSGTGSGRRSTGSTRPAGRAGERAGGGRTAARTASRADRVADLDMSARDRPTSGRRPGPGGGAFLGSPPRRSTPRRSRGPLARVLVPLVDRATAARDERDRRYAADDRPTRGAGRRRSSGPPRRRIAGGSALDGDDSAGGSARRSRSSTRARTGTGTATRTTGRTQRHAPGPSRRGRAAGGARRRGARGDGGTRSLRRRERLAAIAAVMPRRSRIRRTQRVAARRHRSRRADPARRAMGLLIVFGLLFLAVVVRLADVQVARSGRYVAYGEDHRVRAVPLQAGRGALFDRNGNELAISIPTQSIYADPRLVTEPETTARRLARVLDLDAAAEADLAARLGTSGSQFTYVARQVDDGKAARVADLDLAGIDFVEEPKRYYPAGDLAASLLGTVGVDGDGVSGLEQRYDEELQGEPGELIREVDPDGNTIPAGRRQVDPAEPGDDLELTIDRVLQHETERILGEHIARTGSRGGVAIVSNPRTGELLSLANLEWDAEAGRAVNTGNDTAVTANFEPGSVNKVITMAAALEEGIVTPDTVMSVPDSLRVADHTFTDSHSHPTEDYSVTQILAESSNIGTIQIAQRVGADRLDDYLRRFGFGESTALGLPHEENGELLDADDWSGTSIGAIPIGQGISVTAMQMLLAYNTIANDGVYQPPTLVSATLDEDGERHEAERADGRRVVSPTTAQQVSGMLEQVVADGTGTAAAIDGYAVAGKTGTARKPQPGGGYVDEDGRYRYVATFAGFLPADDPELSIIVVMDEPTTSPYAGDVAAPAFAEIGHYALRRMRIPPTALTAGTTAGVDQERVRSTPATTVAPPTTQPPTTQPATTVTTVPGTPGATPPTTAPATAAPPTTAAPPAGAPPTTDPRLAAPTRAAQGG